PATLRARWNVAARFGRRRSGRSGVLAGSFAKVGHTRPACVRASDGGPGGDAALRGPARELGAPAQPGLLADPLQVVVHRPRRDGQPLPDLPVGEALDDQPQHLLLTCAQRRPGVAARTAAGLASADPGRPVAVARRHDRPPDLLDAGTPAQVAARAGGEHGADAVSVVVDPEGDEAGL